MRKLGYLYARSETMQTVVNNLITTFNTEKQENQPTMQFKDLDLHQIYAAWYGVLVFDYDDGTDQPPVVEEKPKFIGMRAGTDPLNPETWQTPKLDQEAL